MTNLANDLQILIKHDFLAKAQGSYFSKMKEEIAEGEFVISMDFAENYTFHVQNAIQAHHWANTQATLHPFVIYYRKNEQQKHLSFVIISEKLSHDTSSVHLFISKVIKYLKNTFGNEKVKKIFYFSDGAASQYKNKYNFINLMKHQEDFGIGAQWNFFATSHGKGACDGIGGTVKRQAYRTSLQRIDKNHITNPGSLFEWASIHFSKIKFEFCTVGEHDEHEKSLKTRFKDVKTIKNTRQYHCYEPLDNKKLSCKLFSNDSVFVEIVTSGKK